MRKVTATLALFIFTALPAALLAGPVPYDNVGHIATTTITTATETGNIIGYFVQADASFTDTVRLVDTTTNTASPWLFNNHATAVGTAADFGYVRAGDNLVFEIYDTVLDQTFSSDPALSADGVNHAYITSFAGGTLYGTSIPSGIYIGMEDLNASNSDFDYNDDTFLFTNNASKSSGFTKTSNFLRTIVPSAPGASAPDPIPEPSTLVLFGTGLVGLAGAIRRRIPRASEL